MKEKTQSEQPRYLTSAQDLDHPADWWRVEYFDSDGAGYITIFAGQQAEARASPRDRRPDDDIGAECSGVGASFMDISLKAPAPPGFSFYPPCIGGIRDERRAQSERVR